MDTNENINLCEDYVSFETAKLLNIKGFKGEFHKHYWGYEPGKEFLTTQDFNPEYDYPAPTLQMAMKWLRKKYNIHIEPRYFQTPNIYRYVIIHSPVTIANIDSHPQYFNTYEAACEAAIKYCLENLIWIMKYYTGNIIPEENTIFVFGSNPEGRHGAGAAKVAVEKFGAIYGQGEGLQGNAYALPTKDLRVKENHGYRSISPEQIIENIKKLYNCAKVNPHLNFKVAYRNTQQRSLNGYTGLEMIEMFKAAGPIPENMWFSEEWIRSGILND